MIEKVDCDNVRFDIYRVRFSKASLRSSLCQLRARSLHRQRFLTDISSRAFGKSAAKVHPLFIWTRPLCGQT